MTREDLEAFLDECGAGPEDQVLVWPVDDAEQRLLHPREVIWIDQKGVAAIITEGYET